MRTLRTVPISAEAFAPYGELIEAPVEPGRTYFDRALCNRRDGVACSLSVAHIAPAAEQPLIATRMERHEFSSQTFLPLLVGSYVVVVADHGSSGGPDVATARAFLVQGHQGITYAVNTWHHPMTVLGGPARSAVLMWRDGGPGDEEFVTLSEPLRVTVDIL
ncbi:MAG: ureidoglycolate lyase [Hyphomicrobiaceae bacterium]